MINETSQGFTVKGKYDSCKGFECPRLLSLMKENEDGTKYCVEGDMAYYAMVLCNNWAVGLSDGECAVKPVKAEI